MPIIWGITFMVGMMLTDTIDSFVVYQKSIKPYWSISFKAFLYMKPFLFFFPWAELDFEIVGEFILTFSFESI